MVPNKPRIIFPEGFDARAAFEMQSRGWINVQVEIASGDRYPVLFIDPIRLQQEITAAFEQGFPYHVDSQMVVVPELRIEAIEQAVEFLW